MSERRLILHSNFNDNNGEMEYYWTMAVATPRLLRRGVKWKTQNFYTPAGPIPQRWWDKNTVKKVAKHYGIDAPMPPTTKSTNKTGVVNNE